MCNVGSFIVFVRVEVVFDELIIGIIIVIFLVYGIFFLVVIIFDIKMVIGLVGKYILFWIWF